jgi:hypothetical protein
MTAPIVTHLDRMPSKAAVETRERDGDRTVFLNYGRTVPGQLWERIAEGKTR